ncbi:YebB family permuted papain-like enzyme [Ideonella sp. A 288]|uniref:YebB family permuted papain-like enzyme n=1 Tax=Ideonella sp. A 288 TaxID=1962181 RepID=UPI001F1F2EA1|nr:YebB family permuted papain-like enzyme [Ideonella sp. A 288]
MTRHPHRSAARLRVLTATLAALAVLQMPAGATGAEPAASGAAAASATLAELTPRLAVGDLVFIRVGARPFVEVAAATGSWTNHVGVVVDTTGAEPVIAESTVPWSRLTPLSRFAGRSQDGRVAVAPSAAPLSTDQQRRVAEAAQRRLGTWYDTGFDLHSRRQFCSRFVREVLAEATGVQVGEVETFGQLLERHPEADQRFWTLWYLGSIPWQRETVTPASVLHSPRLVAVFDGRVAARRAGRSD